MTVIAKEWESYRIVEGSNDFQCLGGVSNSPYKALGPLEQLSCCRRNSNGDGADMMSGWATFVVFDCY